MRYNQASNFIQNYSSVWSIFQFKRIGWANKWKQELEEGYNEKGDLGFQK